MAREMMDTFEARHLRQWTAVVNSAIVSVSADGGSFGAQISGGTLKKTFAVARAERYWGFFLLDSNVIAFDPVLLRWLKGATELGSLRFNSGSRKLEIYTGTATLQATGSKVFSDNVFYHFQPHVSIGTSGEIGVKIDDVLDVSFSGNTKPGSDADFDTIILGANHTLQIDGFIVNDTTGSINNSWTGVRRWKPCLVNADGAHTAWDKSTGSTGYTLVDEAPPNDDTDYVSSVVNGQKVSFSFAAHGLPSTANIKAVIDEYVMKKVSTGQVRGGRSTV